MSDRLTLLHELGAGGQGAVHAARLGERLVAVKRLRAGASAEGLHDEARVALHIVHPNVVRTLEVLERDGELLLVMEYVPGLPLAELAEAASRTGELAPVAVAAGIIAQALDGLAAAHSAVDEAGVGLDVVHRDLSPDNLMVDGAGQVRVLDFGIARARGRRQPTTEAGTVKGKLGYLAPEQLYGDATARSDLWALGVVLWELLTGRRLFVGDSEPAALARALTARVAPPSELRAGVGPALDAAVLSALQRDDSLRVASAADLAGALRRAGVAPAADIAQWVRRVLPARLAEVQPAAIDGPRRVARVRATAAGLTRSTRLRVVLGGAALLIALGGAATGWFLRPAARLEAPLSAPAVVPATEHGDGAPGTAAADPMEPPPAPEPVAPVVLDHPPRPARAVVRPKAKPAGQASPRCDPPWVLDALGHKRYLRECFH